MNHLPTFGGSNALSGEKNVSNLDGKQWEVGRVSVIWCLIMTNNLFYRGNGSHNHATRYQRAFQLIAFFPISFLSLWQRSCSNGPAVDTHVCCPPLFVISWYFCYTHLTPCIVRKISAPRFTWSAHVNDNGHEGLYVRYANWSAYRWRWGSWVTHTTAFTEAQHFVSKYLGPPWATGHYTQHGTCACIFLCWAANVNVSRYTQENLNERRMEDFKVHK